MKKYFILVFCFLFLLFLLFYLYFINPAQNIYSIKSEYTQPSFSVYKFKEYPYIDYISDSPNLLSDDLPILIELTEKEKDIKQLFIKFLSNNWIRFIQYNENDYCIFSTAYSVESVVIEYCNSELFKRSINLALEENDIINIYGNLEKNFIFKIQANELEDLLNETDSYIISNTY